MPGGSRSTRRRVHLHPPRAEAQDERRDEPAWSPRGAALAPERSAQHNAAVQLAELAARSGWLDRRAYVEHERAWTHGECHRAVASSATLLAELGVREGDRVLIALHDRIGFVLAFLGAAHLGALAVPVNPRLGPKDYDFMVHDAVPRLVVCEEEIAVYFPGTPVLSASDLEREGPRQPPAPPAILGADAPLYGQYTSGTTGRPKLVVHRHSDLACHAAAVAHAALELTPEDVLYSVSRAYFSYGLGNTVFCALSTGASTALQPELPTIDAVSELVARVRPSVMFAVPTFYAVLLADGDPEPFRSLRVAVSAGEALSPTLQARASSWLGVPILDGLGSTEVGHLFIANTLRQRRAGSCGHVLPGYEISIRDLQDEEVPRGSVGSLWVRGPTLMAGYHNRPEETARVLVDGWLRTGDRVAVDGDGFVHHCGRSDDLEMVGGITISPLEIETLLVSHSAVAEVAVIAVTDAIGASRLRAFVVPASGCAGSPELEAELTLLAREHLAAYKVPRSVRFVDKLPRTATGKLQRHVLRAGWPQPSPSAA
ncbi:MAG TPA: benzoate-CoA ligase family protein [Acidimicrobiales bacterium]|nr:benzoate-CoA ligase family protein [Acidimicrobiales bacterium]